MGTILNKLWSSKGTILIILWVIALSLVYALDYTRKPIKHTPQPTGKTLEEIMASPADNSPEPAWDKDFKSSIEAPE